MRTNEKIISAAVEPIPRDPDTHEGQHTGAESEIALHDAGVLNEVSGRAQQHVRMGRADAGRPEVAVGDKREETRGARRVPPVHLWMLAGP